MPIHHDWLFKELLTAYLEDFLVLFAPQLAELLEPSSLQLVDKEHYPKFLRQRGRVSDLVARARMKGKDACLIILLEHESRSRPQFPWRLFDYFARLYEDPATPVYPIVIYSYASPRRRGSSSFRLRVAEREILTFRFHVVQLNRLRWRDFLDKPNPVASALMARMNVKPAERPRVKAECLRMLAHLQLDPRKSNTIGKFIDSYIRLDRTEEETFERIIDSFGPEEQIEMRRYVSSWEERGIEKGRLEGMKETFQTILNARFGERAQALQLRIQNCHDLARLKRLAELLPIVADLSELELIVP